MVEAAAPRCPHRAVDLGGEEGERGREQEEVVSPPLWELLGEADRRPRPLGSEEGGSSPLGEVVGSRPPLTAEVEEGPRLPLHPCNSFRLQGDPLRGFGCAFVHPPFPCRSNLQEDRPW